MALSYVKYTGDGVTKNYAVTFEYIAAADVTVAVDGVAVPFTWLNESLVQITTAPASGSLIDIRRSTKKDGALVDFEDASTLTSTDLDTINNQLLFITQEAFDTAQDALLVPPGQASYDAKNKRIINVADPVNDQDATNKRSVLSLTAGQVAAATLAASNAQTYMNGASASAIAAATSLSSASTAAADAIAAKGVALDAKNAALTAQAAAELAASQIGSGLFVSVKQAPFNAVGNGIADDTAAIKAARDYCYTLSPAATLCFPKGDYLITDTIEIARNDFSVIALDASCSINYRGTAAKPALSLDGFTYGGMGGSARQVIGGMFPLRISGNAVCTAGLSLCSLQHGDVNVSIRDCAVPIKINDFDLNPNKICVCTRFRIRHTYLNAAATSVPTNSIWIDSIYASDVFLLVETGGANSDLAVKLRNSNGNLIRNGTVESASHGGLFIAASCSRNTFLNVHNEYNGGSWNFYCLGHHNTFINVAGQGDGNNEVGGNYNLFMGCDLLNVVVDAAATKNTFFNCLLAGTFTDSGTGTVLLNNEGQADKGPWTSTFTAYTPTVSSSSGTITTVNTGATRGQAKVDAANVVEFSLVGAITTNGTGAGTVRISVPYAAADTFVFYGINAVNGVPCVGELDAGTAFLFVRNLDGSYPGINGAQFVFSGRYRK